MTKYVGNKFFNRQEKLKDHHNKILDKKEENRIHRLDIDSTKKSLEINKNRLADNKKSDNEMNRTMSNDYKDLIDDHKNEIERLKAKYKSE